MSAQDTTINKVTGFVTEALPNTEFKVQLEGDRIIHAYLSGKMKLNRIRVLVGDKVEIELNPYDGKSRLTRRL
ncbi:MAG: translation initiation factor IF-1 [Candidatus Paceibacterota bacterium]|jgi:translation initiation factor IF-1